MSFVLDSIENEVTLKFRFDVIVVVVVFRFVVNEKLPPVEIELLGLGCRARILVVYSFGDLLY